MFQKVLLFVPFLAIGWLVACNAASAESRVALVIGNSSYQHVPALTNPINDAKAVTNVLTTAGFDVSLKLDLNQSDLRREVGDFAARIIDKGPDSIALVFYAGHGLQLEGESYLVPVDARIEREPDVAIETVRLSDLTKALEVVPSRMRIIILDACRNNPFLEQANIPGHGLAIVDAPTGSIVAYSTAPGSEAEDGTGLDSPFTSAMLEVITQPNLEIERFFKQVRLRVHRATDGRQTPWESSSLTGDFAFFGAGLTVAHTEENEIHTSVARPTAAISGRNGASNAEPRPSPTIPMHGRLEQMRSRPVEDAYSLAIEEDSVELYQEFLNLHGTDPLARRVRGLLAQRLHMVAWYAAITMNTLASYQVFLERYPASEYAATARRMLERARQRGINPVTAAAFPSTGSLAPSGSPGTAACPPQELRPIPIRATPPILTPPQAEPPLTPAPPVIIKHPEPPVRHVKRGGQPTSDTAHRKTKSTRRSDARSRAPEDGDRPVQAHPSDDGSAIAGALLGVGVGLAIGGGFHQGGGFHHNGAFHRGDGGRQNPVSDRPR
jgi:Caspase domain